MSHIDETKVNSPEEIDVPECIKVQADRMCRNLARVDHLVDLHSVLEGFSRDTNTETPDITDILRSAVVLLHASLEDFIRSIAFKHLPKTDSGLLNQIPLAGADDIHKIKFSLGELARHQGKNIESVIDESIDHWLNQKSFNNTNDIVAMLGRIRLDPKYCEDTFPEIDAMISRRHCIVHNADRPTNSDGMEATINAISRETVEKWKKAVYEFMKRVLYKLQFVQKAQSD